MDKGGLGGGMLDVLFSVGREGEDRSLEVDMGALTERFIAVDGEVGRCEVSSCG